ncbi:MAG: hypothetical protein OK457_03585 [Thaumarchaeota archaeon]|nr:hypothetical protein [Nitrososphaerota archaeon]
MYDLVVKRGLVVDPSQEIHEPMGESFFGKVARLAFEEGVTPYTISTDLHTGSIGGPAYDLPTVMSKFLLLGMSLDEVIAATTSHPAVVLNRAAEIGTLKIGASRRSYDVQTAGRKTSIS